MPPVELFSVPSCLAIGFLFLGIWIGRVHWSQKSGTIPARSIERISRAPLSDSPTVRVGDSQRIDRLHRVVTLRVGQSVDLLDVTFDRIPKLRIRLQMLESGTPTRPARAKLWVELGGATAGCGSAVEQVSPNEFWAPLASEDEQRYSILHFAGQRSDVSFLRLRIVRLDVAASSADVDVLHLCGRWNA